MPVCDRCQFPSEPCRGMCDYARIRQRLSIPQPTSAPSPNDAEEELREAVAAIACGAYWDDIDGALRLIQAHIAPLLAERDAALAEAARLRAQLASAA